MDEAEINRRGPGAVLHDPRPQSLTVPPEVVDPAIRDALRDRALHGLPGIAERGLAPLAWRGRPAVATDSLRDAGDAA